MQGVADLEKYLIELKGIHKVFGSNTVLNDINVGFPEGRFVTFLGPSGCGKTTLLRTIAGFYNPDKGEVWIDGKRVDMLPAHKRNTPMVFQEYALFPHMNVFDNVAYGLRLQKMGRKDIEERVMEALTLTNMAQYKDRNPNQLSGGQQQRVAIARAIVMRSKILLLDEPLSNLDAKLRETVRVELRMLQRQLNRTFIYVTHDQSEALAMSDIIVVFNKGRIEQVGTPMEVYFKPVSKFVADFIGVSNFLEGKVAVKDGSVMLTHSGRDFWAISQAQFSEGEHAIFSIRPESISLSKSECVISSSACLPVKIVQGMFIGEKVRYMAKDAIGMDWIIDQHDTQEILTGEAFISIPPDKAHVIKE